MTESNLDQAHLGDVLRDEKYWEGYDATLGVVNPNLDSGKDLENSNKYWLGFDQNGNPIEVKEDKPNSVTESTPLYDPGKSDERREAFISAKKRKLAIFSHPADSGETPHERLKQARKKKIGKRASGSEGPRPYVREHASELESLYEDQIEAQIEPDMKLAVIHNSSTTSIEELVAAAAEQFDVSVESLTHAEARVNDLTHYDGVIFSGSDERVAELLLDADIPVYAMGAAATTMAKKRSLPVEKADRRMVSGPNTTFNGHDYNHQFYIPADQVTGTGFEVLAERDGMAYELQNCKIKLVQFRPTNNAAGRGHIGSWLQSVYGKEVDSKKLLDNQPSGSEAATTSEQPKLVRSTGDTDLISHETPAGVEIEIPLQVSRDVKGYLDALDAIVDNEKTEVVNRLGLETGRDTMEVEPRGRLARIKGPSIEISSPYLLFKSLVNGDGRVLGGNYFPGKKVVDQEVLDGVWNHRSKTIAANIGQLTDEHFSYVLKELVPRENEVPFNLTLNGIRYVVQGALPLLGILGRDYVERKRALASAKGMYAEVLSEDLASLRDQMLRVHNAAYTANLEVTRSNEIGPERTLENYKLLNPDEHVNPTIELPLVAGVRTYDLVDKLQALAADKTIDKALGGLANLHRLEEVCKYVNEALGITPSKEQDSPSKQRTPKPSEGLPYNLASLALAYVNLLRKQEEYGTKDQDSLEHEVQLPQIEDGLKHLKEGIVLLTSSEYLRRIESDYFMVLTSNDKPIREPLHEAMGVNKKYVQDNHDIIYGGERALGQMHARDRGYKEGKNAREKLDAVRKRREAGEEVKPSEGVIELELPFRDRMVPLEKIMLH